MDIKGYDAWKLSGPPEWDGPQCNWCGGIYDIRVKTEGCGHVPPVLTCEECFTGQDDGPDFDDLQTAYDYARDIAWLCLYVALRIILVAAVGLALFLAALALMQLI